VKAPSLESRLVLLQMFLAATVMALYAASAIVLSARTLEHEEQTLLSGAAAQFVGSLEAEWAEEKDFARAARSAVQEDAPSGVGVEVLDEQRQSVARTAPLAPSASANQRRLMVHVPRGAWVIVSLSSEPRRRALAVLVTALALAAIPLLLVALALSRALARRALAPLSRMTAQAVASREGRLAPLGGPADPREVAQLADAFNRLLARVSELLEAERHFTQDAAHELRTPLTVISGELESAASDAAVAASRRQSLHGAWEQARDMGALVDALLLLRRAEQTRDDLQRSTTAVNLADMTREATDELSARMPERAADLQVDAPDEVLVSGDAQLLGAAIRNLLSNALKATSRGGHVKVSVFGSPRESVVSVEDDGAGVPPEERERIFDSFYRSARARAEQAGFGLGLPLLRRVARAHRGDVRVDASALGGARFEMRLPAWRPNPEAGAR